MGAKMTQSILGSSLILKKYIGCGMRNERWVGMSLPDAVSEDTAQKSKHKTVRTWVSRLSSITAMELTGTVVGFRR